ncbi:MAG: aminofutalosine synthase MqnE [Planctomycetota bacterium]
MPALQTDPALLQIEAKLDRAERLDAADGAALFATPDLMQLGRLANRVRREKHGDTAFYNVNQHLNYSNVCVLSCKFCEFQRKPGQDGAYTFELEQIAEKGRQAQERGATEMHIVGGLHPRLPWDYYLGMLRTLKQEAPKLHLKAFTAVEVVHLARVSKRAIRKDFGAGVRSLLEELRDAGLDSLPGGGAEVFDDRVHDEAWRGKIRSDEWLTVHRVAHELGLFTNATMLYGHLETTENRVEHLIKLREEQDYALQQGLPARFQCCIPLPFFPDGSALQHLPGPTGLDNLRTLAVARIMLDNVEHIKAFWIMQTLPMAQAMLDWGANDVDGTVVWYDITKVGGASTHQEVTVDLMRRTIREAGYQPIERDTLYRPVRRNGLDWGVVPGAEVPHAVPA